MSVKWSLIGSIGIFYVTSLILAGCSEGSHSAQRQEREGGSNKPLSTENISGDSAGPLPIQHGPSSSSPDSEKFAGLKVQRLAGKAFLIEDFGAAPSGNAVDVIKKLEISSKEGDSRASYELYLKIKECMDLVSGSRTSASAESASTYDQCKDLPADYYASAADWLKLAADQGNVGAQLLYGSDPSAILGNPSDMLRDPDGVRNYKESALGYLDAAADSGSVDALLRLANAYRNGVLVDQNLGISYAYYEAARIASPELVPRRTMEEIAQGLGAKEMTISTQKGREIYGKCCRP